VTGRAGLAGALPLNRVEALPALAGTVRLLAHAGGTPLAVVRVGIAVAATHGDDQIEADRRPHHARAARLATGAWRALAELVRLAIGVTVADSACETRGRGRSRCGSERTRQRCRAMDHHGRAGGAERARMDRCLGDPNDASQVLSAGPCAAAVALGVGGGLSGQQPGDVGGVDTARCDSPRGGPQNEQQG